MNTESPSGVFKLPEMYAGVRDGCTETRLYPRANDRVRAARGRNKTVRTVTRVMRSTKLGLLLDFGNGEYYNVYAFALVERPKASPSP